MSQELFFRCSVCGVQFQPEDGRWHGNQFVCNSCTIPDAANVHYYGTLAFQIEEAESGAMEMVITQVSLISASLDIEKLKNDFVEEIKEVLEETRTDDYNTFKKLRQGDWTPEQEQQLKEQPSD